MYWLLNKSVEIKRMTIFIWFSRRRVYRQRAAWFCLWKDLLQRDASVSIALVMCRVCWAHCPSVCVPVPCVSTSFAKRPEFPKSMEILLTNRVRRWRFTLMCLSVPSFDRRELLCGAFFFTLFYSGKLWKTREIMGHRTLKETNGSKSLRQPKYSPTSSAAAASSAALLPLFIVSLICLQHCGYCSDVNNNNKNIAG